MLFSFLSKLLQYLKLFQKLHLNDLEYFSLRYNFQLCLKLIENCSKLYYNEKINCKLKFEFSYRQIHLKMDVEFWPFWTKKKKWRQCTNLDLLTEHVLQ